MKMRQGKRFALLAALALPVPLLWNRNAAVANAATPTFADSTIEVVGAGESYQLVINDEVSGSTYKWSSSDTKVAKISGEGLITTVNKGTSTIKCKITYPSGKSKTISCKVTVTIPATQIRINNATEVNGAHVLALGSSFDFNRDIVPANTSDKTYWSVGGGDESCITVDSTSGKVTAVKAGKVILVATAAKKATAGEAEKSIINDAIIIEVVGPSASVGSTDIISSTEIKVVFDSPIDKTTILDNSNKLLNNIEITPKKNIKGVMAQDPGTLTGNLSADSKTLIITASNSFDGEYGINFTSNIKTTDGIAIDSYYKQLSFVDTIAPAILSTTLDDTGLVETIQFTEAVDLTNFKALNAQVVPMSSSVDPNTISILNNKLNYIASEDKKSLTINLSKIAAADYGKTFLVTLSGIKDMSGNTPASFTLTVYLRTDITPKPQARALSVLRTSYNTITATFDRGIQFGGYATINGVSHDGVVDVSNNKKVNYTLSDAEALLTGWKTVSIGFWNAYNVIPTDISASQMKDFNVNFTADVSNPVLQKFEFDPETSTLTLTYNKEVTLYSNTGIFSATLSTITEDVEPGCNITYTKATSTDNKVIVLKLGNMTLLGNYTFTLDQGFALDNFKNKSLQRTLTISNATGTSTELQPPYAIRQNPANLSEIYVDFASKLDPASATTISNYNIRGVTIISASIYKNTSDNGATVLLTVADGSIDVTTDRPVTISGIKGYNGNYSAMSEYTTSVELKDNKKPYLIDYSFDKTSKNVVKLNFNEEIKGTLTVKVTQMGTAAVEITNTVTITGNSAYIRLDSIPVNGSYLKIDVLSNKITDVSGNQSTLQATLGVPASY